MPARTLSSPIECTGVGLFTAKPSTIRFEPTPLRGPRQGLMLSAGTGCNAFPITAATIDQEPLHPAFARMAARSTNLVLPDGRRLATLEHALSALIGSGITDATIRLIGTTPHADVIETPILDGSSKAFADEIARVGTSLLEPDATAGSAAEPIVPAEPMVVGPTDGDHTPDTPTIRIDPPLPGQSRPVYRYCLRYDNAANAHRSLQPSTAEWSGEPDSYAEEVAPARTYALDTEAAAMNAAGLFTHLTPRDMLVIAPTGPVDNALRFPNEPARHKLLDLIGDLALAGRPILATITADRSGHALNHRAAAAIRLLGNA